MRRARSLIGRGLPKRRTGCEGARPEAVGRVCRGPPLCTVAVGAPEAEDFPNSPRHLIVIFFFPFPHTNILSGDCRPHGHSDSGSDGRSDGRSDAHSDSGSDSRSDSRPNGRRDGRVHMTDFLLLADLVVEKNILIRILL